MNCSYEQCAPINEALCGIITSAYCVENVRENGFLIQILKAVLITSAMNEC